MIRAIPLAALFAFPTLCPAQISITVTPSKDNSMYQNSPSFSNGAGTGLFAGNTAGNSPRRALVHFDVAASVPRCSQIVSVTLTMQMERTRGGATNVGLHPVTQDWGEGTSVAGRGGGSGAPATNGDATWSHRIWPNQTWTNRGGDFLSTASGATSVAGFGSYTWSSTAQMVADVQSWLDDSSTNFGWLLLGDETRGFTAKRFASRESSTTANRPTLTISYNPPRAAVTSTGTSCGGLVLSANGLPQVPNPNFALWASGGPPVFYVFARTLATNPISLGGGCFAYVDVNQILAVVAGGQVFPQPVPNNTALFGAEAAVQATAITITGRPAISNALSIKLGL